MTIKSKKLQEVSPSLRQAYERGKGAVSQRNYTYAFQILRDVLRTEPGFWDARLALRQGQLERVGNKSTAMNRAIASLTTLWPIRIQGPQLLKKGKHAEALDLAEAAMQVDPTLMSTISFLSRAAQEAKLLNVAVNALEVGTYHNPKNTEAMKALAVLYNRAGEDGKALQVRQRICELRPDDGEAQNELKQATAMAAMKKGKWDTAESYRDVIKDKELAQTLEQKERIAARDEETLRSLVTAAEKTVAEKATVANHKKLGDLYRQSRDLAKALEQYNLVVEKTGAMDPSIDTAITDVMCMRFDDAVSQWQTFAEQNPTRREEAEAKIVEIKGQKTDMILQRTKDRVERYPNDANFHFELAELYWERQDVDQALREYQFAQRSPQMKRRAQFAMGKCLAAKNLAEMAAEQFQAFLAEPGLMDTDRKDCLYELGLIHETAGRKEEALKCFKEIFSADVNFRDVGAKVEAYYQTQNQG